MSIPLKVATDNRGFATKLTPVTTGGILRYNRSAIDLTNDFLNGELAIKRLLFTAASTLTISSGSITTTLNQHIVAAETGTADDLTTIVVANNKFVFLRARPGDTITLKHGSSNIHIPGLNDIILSGNRGVLLFCENSYWGAVCTSTAKANFSAIVDPGSGDDTGDGYSIGSLWLNTAHDRVWICTDNTSTTAQWKLITGWENSFRLRAQVGATATVVGDGVLVSATTQTIAVDNNNTFNQFTSGSSGSVQGIISQTFNLERLDFDPVFECILQTFSAVSSVRFWVGMTSVDPTNSDTAGGLFVGFRYSAGVDTGWTPILRDGVTQSAGTTIGTVATSTVYKLRIRVESSSARACFSVNDGAEQVFSTNFPAVTSELGFCFRVIATTASGRSLNFASMEIGW